MRTSGISGPVVVLTGGTGGAKLVQGLAGILPPDQLTVVVNTGDDLDWWGLHVSPDLDSVTYALAGLLSRGRGWGVEGDTFECLARMRGLGAPAWFQVGDRDLALHLTRTALLAQGKTLSEATRLITRTFGVAARVLPMTDSPLETRVLTDIGELSFQEYFVRERCRPAPLKVTFAGAEVAPPAPGVVEAIRSAAAVLIAPSNPITSIGPILSVDGIRKALHATRATVAAVSPIVGGAAVSGPAGELMRASGLPVSAAGVARVYAGFLDLLVADERDRETLEIPSGVDVWFTNTLMMTDEDKQRLAEELLAAVALREKRAAAG